MGAAEWREKRLPGVTDTTLSAGFRGGFGVAEGDPGFGGATGCEAESGTMLRVAFPVKERGLTGIAGGVDPSLIVVLLLVVVAVLCCFVFRRKERAGLFCFFRCLFASVVVQRALAVFFPCVSRSEDSSRF